MISAETIQALDVRSQSRFDCVLLRDYRHGFFSTWLVVEERAERGVGRERAREKYRELFGAYPSNIVGLRKDLAKVGPIAVWAEDEAEVGKGFGSKTHLALAERFYRHRR